MDTATLKQTLHDNRQPLTSTPNWPIDEIVGRLSALRRQTLEARNRLQKPTILPSREALARIVEKLALVLFPNRLGNRELAPTSIDYFVGQQLDVTLNELLHQVEIEIKFSNPEEIEDRMARDRAIEIVHPEKHSNGRRHPLVEDDVIIYANATILGNVTIGSQAIIGGNIWITENIPPRSRVSQAKALMGTFAGGEGI